MHDHVHETSTNEHDHFDEAYWDERYSSQAALWSGNPNPQLVAEVGDLTPGTALDVGCGEGADAIWLAERGWQVTAVDISVVALERGRARAATLGPEVSGRIEWRQTNFSTWAPAEASYDLVSAQFFHLPRAQRDGIFRSLAAAVAPGGTLLIVGHHPSDMQAHIPRPQVAEMFFTAEDLSTKLLDPQRWDMPVREARERTVTNPEGKTVTVRDTVLRACKR